MITTILPVSRTFFLDRVLETLKNQTVKINNLIVVFDGHDNDFLYVRNKVSELPFDNVITVPSHNRQVAHTIADRRRHIVNIHNQIRELIEDADWIFSVEDDGILPLDALEKLIKHSKKLDNVGMVTGVELGRWGTRYVGAWRVNNIHEPSEIESLQNKTSTDKIEEIDGCGLYCALIRADMYKQHVFFTHNGLGPDVNLGLFLRQQGYKNYIDWSVHVTHVTFLDGEYTEIPATMDAKTVKFTLMSGSTWKY